MDCKRAKLRLTRPPHPLALSDTLLMACIWHINLDAFWSWAAAMVEGNKDKSAAVLQMSEAAGLAGPYETDGTLPEFDHCGHEVTMGSKGIGILQARPLLCGYAPV
jgi:hypothetical protein